MSLVGLVVGLVLSVARGAFGDLFRALGLASFLAVTRSHRLSAEYPFLPYARRALVMLPRRPFPPAENPWKYKRADALAELEEAGVADDGNLPAEFSMAKVWVGRWSKTESSGGCSGSRVGGLDGGVFWWAFVGCISVLKRVFFVCVSVCVRPWSLSLFSTHTHLCTADVAKPTTQTHPSFAR